MERLLKNGTGFRSDLMHHCDSGTEEKFPKPQRDVPGCTGWRWTEGVPGISCRKPQVGGSCGRVLYSFIHLFIFSRGRCHYYFRYKVVSDAMKGYCLFCHADDMQENPRLVHQIRKPCFPWSLLNPLLFLIILRAFQLGNNKINL